MEVRDGTAGMADHSGGSLFQEGRTEGVPTTEDHTPPPAWEDLCQGTGSKSTTNIHTTDSGGTIRIL